MLYVQQSLGPNEELVRAGHFHWMYTVQAFFMIIWGVLGAVLFLFASVYMQKQLGQIHPAREFLDSIQYVHPGLRIFGFIIFLLGLFSFAQMMITKATTEIAVTSNRMIYKRGLVSRNIGEIRIDRVEGVNVLQSILGRLFGYGRLAIRGTGVGEVVLPPIDDPIIFRKAIEHARRMDEKKR